MTPGQNGIAPPRMVPLISKPFLAGAPEKVLAKTLIKKNTGPNVVLSYDLSNGLKDLTLGEMHQDKHNNLWVTTVYGGVFKFDGKYFHYLAEAQGLSNNTVRQILFTSDDEVWFGSIDGLSRYDGKYMTNYTTEKGLISNWINDIEEDTYGNIWILTPEGLQMIDKNRENTYTFDLGNQKGWGQIQKDGKGNLWMSCDDNTIVGLDLSKASDQSSYSFYFYKHQIGGVRQFHLDHSEKLWVGTSKGFFRISFPGNDYEKLVVEDHDIRMQSSARFITNIDEDNQNRLWISTREQGVFILEPGNGISAGHYSNLIGPADIPESFVTSVFIDRSQNVWIGSGGLTLIKKNPFRVIDQIKNPRCIAEDHQKNLWIGSDKGLYKFNPKSPETALLYTQNEGLPNNDVFDVLVDKNGEIWVSTWVNGFVLFQPGGPGKAAGFLHFPRRVGLPSEYITKFIEDEHGKIWFSTYEDTIEPTSGLSKIEGSKMTFFGVDQGLIHEDVMAMDLDIFGNFWVGSWGLGINKYQPGNGNRKATVHHFTNKHIPIENRVRVVKADSKGNVWTGGYGSVGLTQFLPSKLGEPNYYRHYSLSQGLSSTNLVSALEDDKGNLWFGTAYGMNLLPSGQVEQPTNHRPIISFTELSGFPAIACERKVLFQSSDGMIWVGADGRLIGFDPKELTQKPEAPAVFLNGITLFSQPIRWKMDTTYVLENGKIIQDFRFDSLSHFNYIPHGLSLSYRNNFIDFDYGVYSIDESQNASYQTILVGLEKNWSSSTTESRISYNGLRHGKYLFKVRARMNNGTWGAPTEFPFTIRPPWWLTWWAYTIYVLIGISALYLIYQFQLRRNLDKAESQRLIELDAVKTKMYTNITHEFRTPLTVISGMAAQIKESPKEWFSDGLTLIQKNTNRLLNLVNQMLDLSKLESGNLALNLEQGNMVSYLKYLVESIHSLAESKNIQLHFRAEEDEVIMDYDPEKIQQIIINLLSNAVKFTPENGYVFVEVKQVEPLKRTDSLRNTPLLQIHVSDNGPGIPEEQLPFIFDRFYQVDDSSTRQKEGSGIGLALVKELIHLMDGEISVKSQVGKETVFTIILPIRNEAKELHTTGVDTSLIDTTNKPETVIPVPQQEENGSPYYSSKPRVLLIEDNPDVVAYIAACLHEAYDIKVGKDGKEGVEIAIEHIPDLIITDVMMPFMDGYSVCDTLKNDKRTSHIPIIMLTAKADIDSKLEGLEKGADAYLTKPFHKKELIVRIKKLLELREKLQGHYRSVVTSGRTASADQEIAKNATPENSFVIRLKEVVESHLDDQEFTVEKLCREIGISHSQLHRKMTALTGLSPNKFILFVRLNKAKEFLKDPEKNISTVAYETGFNHPSYFGRAFKKEFGMTPMEWKGKE